MKILNGLPKDTKIYGDGLKVSSWGGKMALVTTTTSEYDDSLFLPQYMTRTYHVRYLTYDRKHIPTNPNDPIVGHEPAMTSFNRKQPYHLARATVGTRYDNRIEVGFTKSTEYFVRVKPSDLNSSEKRKLDQYLEKRGYVDVGDVSRQYKVKQRDWKKAFSMSEQELLNGSSDVSYAIDHLLGKGKMKQWPPNGIYFTTTKGDIKGFMSKNGNTRLIESSDVIRNLRRLTGFHV